MSNDTESPEIPALGEGYSHARKAYGLTCALLMAWELIGVELQASPIENLKLTLKSPQAAPYVLIVLIIYFGFRVTIEWYQTDIRRRSLRASRIDFIAAHAIAVAALALYGFQTLSKIQVANTTTPSGVIFFAAGFMSGMMLHRFVRERHSVRDWWKESWFARLYFSGMLMFGFATLCWMLYVAARQLKFNLLLIFAAGLFLGFIFMMVARKRITGRS